MKVKLLALAPCLAPLLFYSDLSEIETALLEIDILSFELENKHQPNEGLIFELCPSIYFGKMTLLR